MADIATKIPETNWVRLEIEPVQVSHDGDETLNFATVQSVVPGAHGLYYRDDGERKALLFDNNTGKVYPPPNGWDSVPIFIHLAHGSRHNHGTHFADYSKANDAFERNISAVQRLFAAAGLGSGRSNKVHTTSKTRARSTSKKNQPRSQFDAQPENVNISEESEDRDSEKEKNDRQVEKLKNRNDELKIRVKEYKSDLSAAQLKIKNLEKKLETVKATGYFEEDGDKFVRIDSESDEKNPEHDEEVNNLHNVIEELRDKLALVDSKKKEIELKFSENQEYLKNAKEKVAYLEHELNSEGREEAKSTAVRSLEVKLGMAQNSIRQLEADKQQLQEANWYANERSSKLEQENGYLKGVTEQLKNRSDGSHLEKMLRESEKRVIEINEEKSKLEWRLGELSQWWNDAKWKVGELESSVALQRNLLDTANLKIQGLNDQSNSSTVSIPTDGFTISQGQKGNWNLANGTAQPCFTGAIPSIPLVSALPFAGANPFIFGGSAEGRNVTLTITNEEKEVYLTGSFINWKCTLKCEKLASGKKGVTVNLTRGRHEFRFMINGEWSTSTDYQQVPNGLGGQNNVIFVE